GIIVTVAVPGLVVAARAVRGVRAVAFVAVGPAWAVEFADQLVVGFLVLATVVVVVRADVARLLGALLFFLIGPQHRRLDDLPTGGVDGVRDVGVELGPAVGVAAGAVLVQFVAALVAVAGSQVVLAPALPATVSQLATRHRHKGPLCPFDDFQVAH